MILFGAKKYCIGDLMYGVEQNRQGKASQCGVVLKKTLHELKKESIWEKFKSFFSFNKKPVNAYYVTFAFEVTSDTGSTHKVYIRTAADSDSRIGQQNRVEIYCDCPDFKYRTAYDLNKHDSLLLTDRTRAALGAAVGQKPKKQGVTVLCKHAAAALQWLMNNYSQVMRQL